MKYLLSLIFLFLIGGNCSYAQHSGLLKLLEQNSCTLSARINQYDTSRFNYLTGTKTIPLSKATGEVEFQQATWEVQIKAADVKDRPGASDLAVTFICKKGSSPNTSLSVDISFDYWSDKNYVLLPGAAYNGNRFDWRRIGYSPKLLDPRDIGPDKPVIITDVPKLNHANGPSRIQERSGSMATPAVGFYSPAARKAFWMLTQQRTSLGDSGIDIEESSDRNRAVISVTAPVVRELYKYRITDMRYPSDDKPANFKAGDSLTIRLRLYFFESPQLQGLFDQFSVIRKDLSGNSPLAAVLPFSAAFKVQEKKFDSLNYVPRYGYYSVGRRENFLQDWQIGWTGGMISTYPLFFAGNDSTKRKVIRNFDWLFPNGISPSGFFWDAGEGGTTWYGGDIRKPHTKNWHLIRKSGDGLYYIIRQFMLMEQMGHPVKEEWKTGTRGVADAFVRLWKNAGQFGQFVDSHSGKVMVGGSTSGGIVPGALVLAAKYFGKDEYLVIAKESAEAYYKKYVQRGITCGGPGDAMQNPDSESGYALIESYTTLYELTGDKKWLSMAEDASRQFSTWVMSYDYQFPANSLFGRLDIKSTGAVIANTQNKHGAPGICTFSGLALLKLYRATGNPFYAALLQDIARNMPQYLSHPQKPIPKMNWGWMCERVNTTDWLEGIGEISYLTTWAETAMMLTSVEIPGLYVQPDRSFFTAFDHIDAKLIRESRETLTLAVSNPTSIEATIKILAENKPDTKKNLGEKELLNYKKIRLGPGETKQLSFRKSGKAF